MPFHFKKREPVAKAMRRMCCEGLDDALETLEHGDRGEAVHNVRKEIKKLRAIFRLMRGEIGHKIYRRNNQALRAAAGGLTAMRDAQVILNAFKELTKHFRRRLPKRPFPEIEEALRENRHGEEKKFLKGRSASSVRKILRELKSAAGDLQTDSKGWKAIRPGSVPEFWPGAGGVAGGPEGLLAGNAARMAQTGEGPVASSAAALRDVAGRVTR